MVLTPRFFLFFALGFLPILGGINDSRIFVLALAYDAGVVAVTVAEWLLLVRKPGLRIRRDAPSVVSIGVPFEAVIYIENPSAATLRVTVKDSPQPRRHHRPAPERICGNRLCHPKSAKIRARRIKRIA